MNTHNAQKRCHETIDPVAGDATPTVRYCPCGRKLGCQNPGRICSTCATR